MKNILNNSETELMHIFWNVGKPMSSLDLAKISENWSHAYIHVLLRTLLSKNMLRICGFVQSGKQYARQFEPVISREDYEVGLLSDKDIKLSSLLKVAANLVEKQKEDVDEKLLETLDEIISELNEKED